MGDARTHAPAPHVLAGRWVVLGASSAMAQALVRRIASAGGALVLVARDAAKLRLVADDARVRGATIAATIEADLDDARRHGEVLDRAFGALGRVDAVLIAQGLLADSDACEAEPALAERVLLTNFVGPALLGQGAALRLASQGGGTLIAISSVAGDRGRASNYVYGGAKAGLDTVLEGLRGRFAARGVHVVTLKPGFVESPMTAHLPKGRLWAQPDAIAAAIVRSVERRRDVVYAPVFWRAVVLVVRAMPRWLLVKLGI